MSQARPQTNGRDFWSDLSPFCSSIHGSRHNLSVARVHGILPPAPDETFVGREADLAVVRERIVSGTGPLRERFVKLDPTACKKARKSTQEKLAEATELSVNVVTKAESGKSIRIGTALRIAEGLGVRLSELLLPRKNTATRLFLHGWPGVGKSTFLGAIALDNDLQEVFSGGILAASLGPAPDVLTQLVLWSAAFGEPPDLPPDPLLWRNHVRAQLHSSTRRFLILIDDAYRVSDVKALMVGSGWHATVVTTRKEALAERMAGPSTSRYELKVLSDAFSLQLLTHLVPEVVYSKPQSTAELIRSLEGLPLSIQVSGRLLRAELGLSGMTIDQLLSRLRDLKRLLHEEAPTDDLQTHSVNALLRLSTDVLSTPARMCFAYLGAVPAKPAKLPLSTLVRLWQDFMVDPPEMIKELSGRGLMRVLPNGLFWVHSLLVAHAEWLYESLGEKGPTEGG